MTTAEVLTVKQAELITNLFLAGHGLDFICERGVTGATPWSRPVVLELVRRQGWELDGSGRVPRTQRPQPAPPSRAPRPAGRALEAIAEWADGPRPKVAALAPPKPNAVVRRPIPAPAPSAAPLTPAASATATTSRKTAIPPAGLSDAVDRFLTERTIDAPADQFLTSPQLRDAYETWRAKTAAPDVTPRWFGVLLTSKYRKKQANKVIDGTKPICYYGIAWKPATPVADETPTEGTAPGTLGADAAGTAPEPSGSGHGYAGPDAQPQVSPSRSQSGEGGELGASDAPAEHPVTDLALTDHEREFLAPLVSPDDWAWNPDTKCYELRDDEANADVPAGIPGAGGPQPPPGASSDEDDPAPVTSIGVRAHQVDLLAVGLAHSDPKIRAKAARVLAVVDDLCRALARRRP